MKHILLCALTLGAATAVAFVGACSTSTDSGSSSGSSGSSGTSGTSGASGAVVTSSSGTSGTPEQDTCKTAGGSCQCSCAVTGQTLDKTKHCISPSQDTGLCPLVCCTGAIDGGSSGNVDASDASDAGDSG